VYASAQDGQRVYVFGQGGVARAAAEAGVPLLAEVPLTPSVVAASDAGAPVTAVRGAPGAAPFERIAAALAQALQLQPRAPGAG
jgi:ATP-binding protein involved in chromosome partitioning